VVAPAPGATILHADLDAFYASVEQLLDPTLRARPIAVGGGVVLAASYEARATGVRSGMAGWRARQLCPDLQFVGGHFSEYQRLGDRVVEVFNDFTPAVERVSIDEAFLDVAGTVHLFGPAPAIATAIRTRVRAELGLPVSVGVARTKHLAKIASQVAKPDGLVVVPPEDERAFLDPLPVGLIWGVGPATRERLAGSGIHTIGELVSTSPAALGRLVGRANGAKLGLLASNVDPRHVDATRPARSVGAQAALGRAAPSAELVETTLGYLVDRVAGRMRAAGRAARTLTVRVRFLDLRAVTRSVTWPAGISATRTLGHEARRLVEGALADHPGEREITLLAVSLSQLVDDAVLQLELPFPGDDPAVPRPGTTSGAGRWAADRAVDRIRDRFGRASVGYASVALGGADRVPEAFRELAERRLADHPGTVGPWP
jgi:DNA polymerase-4